MVKCTRSMKIIVTIAFLTDFASLYTILFPNQLCNFSIIACQEHGIAYPGNTAHMKSFFADPFPVFSAVV